MGSDMGSKTSVPLVGIISVALLGFAYWPRNPLETSRPSHAAIPERMEVSKPGLRARLWEDPLEVVGRFEKQRKEEGKRITPQNIPALQLGWPEAAPTQADLQKTREQLQSAVQWFDDFMRRAIPRPWSQPWPTEIAVSLGSPSGSSIRVNQFLPAQGRWLAWEWVNPNSRHKTINVLPMTDHPFPKDGASGSSEKRASQNQPLNPLVYSSSPTGLAPFAPHDGDGPHLKVNVQGDGAEVSTESLKRQEADPEPIASAADQSGTVLVLSALLNGEPYPEAAEQRLRARFAVLSALSVCGYIPEDAGYLSHLTVSENLRIEEHKTAEESKAEPHAQTVFRLPFQKLKLEEIANPSLEEPSSPCARYSAVYVLWIDEETLTKDPRLEKKTLPNDQQPKNDLLLSRILRLYREFTRHPELKDKTLVHRIIGPTNSHALQDMIKDGVTLDGYEVFSPWATIAEPVLRLRTPAYQSAAIRRTVPDDQSMVRLILNELALREASPVEHPQEKAAAELDELAHRDASGVEQPQKKMVKPNLANHLVVIGEWDTLYSRSLRCTFVNEILQRPDYDCSTQAEEKLKNVHFFDYFRGLDGKVAGPTVSTEDRAVGPKVTMGAPPESPTGAPQTDYLRRLEMDLHRLEIELKQTQGTIKAIGVLGSDIYDKLLILRALRPRFSGAIFFTTDLDAQLLDEKEYKHTRNMIVASPFGLALHEDLQAHILPFRDSYQTSVFWSTLLATGHVRAQDRSTSFAPRLFEIARNGAFDLQPSDPLHIHPESSADRSWRQFTYFAPRVLLAICLALLLAIFQLFTRVGGGIINLLPAPERVTDACTLLVNRGSRFLPAGQQHVEGSPQWAKVVAVATAASIMIILLVLLPFQYAFERIVASFTEALAGDSREPMSLTGGISAWPTQAIRVFAMLLALWMIVRIWRRLELTREALCDQFDLPKQMDRGPAPSRFQMICLKWPTAMKLWTVDGVWQFACRLRNPCYRVLRITIAVVLFFIFGVVLMNTFGFPYRPVRGDEARFLDKCFLWFSVFSLLFLVFFVHDAARWCHKFIRALRGIGWTDAASGEGNTLQKLRLIGAVSAAVGGLFKYPFIVLLLVIISRHSLFDDWNWPIGLVIVFGSLLAVILFSGCLVRWAAQSARDEALEALRRQRDQIVQAPDGKDSMDRRLVDHAIVEVANLSTGAFAPLREDPMVRALLIHTGGLGVWELMLLMLQNNPFGG